MYIDTSEWPQCCSKYFEGYDENNYAITLRTCIPNTNRSNRSCDSRQQNHDPHSGTDWVVWASKNTMFDLRCTTRNPQCSLPRTSFREDECCEQLEKDCSKWSQHPQHLPECSKPVSSQHHTCLSCEEEDSRVDSNSPFCRQHPCTCCVHECVSDWNTWDSLSPSLSLSLSLHLSNIREHDVPTPFGQRYVRRFRVKRTAQSECHSVRIIRFVLQPTRSVQHFRLLPIRRSCQIKRNTRDRFRILSSARTLITRGRSVEPLFLTRVVKKRVKSTRRHFVKSRRNERW